MVTINDNEKLTLATVTGLALTLESALGCLTWQELDDAYMKFVHSEDTETRNELTTFTNLAFDQAEAEFPSQVVSQAAAGQCQLSEDTCTVAALEVKVS